MFFFWFLIRITSINIWNWAKTRIKHLQFLFNTDKKNDQTTLNCLWQAENIHQKPLSFTFKIELFFDQKKVEMKMKKKIKFLNMKKFVSNCLIHRNTIYEPIQKVFFEQCRKNYPFWEKFKNTFLVNSKKWKNWEKGSSKRNHPKVALTNCHYF